MPRARKVYRPVGPKPKTVPAGKTAKKKQQTKERVQPQINKIHKFETNKQIRADPRAGSNGVNDRLESTTQLKVLTQPFPLQGSLIEDWARGFVMKAVEKGAQAYDSVATPYYAYVYIVKTLTALIVNEEQLSVNVPYCLLAVARGLRSKSARCGNGMVSYATTIETAGDADPTRVVGYQPYGFLWSIGYPTGLFANINWPLQENTLPGYTATLGAAAFQQLCQFLINDSKDGPARIVLSSSPCVMDKDVSMFAYTGPSNEKVGLATAGSARFAGIAYPLNLEVPIKKPMFASFGASADPGIDSQRYGNLHANSCGDGTFLAAGQLTWFTEEKWGMQRPPKLHFIDFYEFADVVAKWVSGIQQAFVNDPDNALADPATVKCTLTLQEMCLLLRNVLMTAFKDSQAGVHSLYPVVPASDTDSQFVPFIVGTNTCFLSSTDMRLPVPLIENIRALIMRFIHRQGEDWEIFIPVLGQYYQKAIEAEDYTYLPPDSEEPLPSFTTQDSIAKRRVIIKGVESFIPMVEEPISLIDGSCSSGQANINDPAALKKMVTLWEAWYVESGVSSYSTDVGLLGTEQGINVLTSINMTRHLALPGATKKAQLAKELNQAGIIDIRHENRHTHHMMEATPYLTSQVLLVSSQSKILATAYEQVQSVWILPVIRANITSPNNTLALRWQGIADEPFSQVVAAIGTTVTLDQMHATYAAKLVRGKLAQKTDWEKLFADLAAKGRGGILSGLVGSFADLIIPGAGTVVRGIGDTIGI